MEITFNKNFPPYKKGDTVRVSTERGNYLVRVGTATAGADSEPDKKEEKKEAHTHKKEYKKRGRKPKQK